MAKDALHDHNPSAPVPHNSTIKRLVDKFRTTGSVHDGNALEDFPSMSKMLQLFKVSW